mgnify:CR=1 FL=1
MRQLTYRYYVGCKIWFSKLPMRQLTVQEHEDLIIMISKLPMRQLTYVGFALHYKSISKLPMRQLTMLERKKKPTARALIHLFPTLTQIYSCFEID